MENGALAVEKVTSGYCIVPPVRRRGRVGSGRVGIFGEYGDGGGRADLIDLQVNASH